MEKELDLKYNMPNIKLFLNIFGLEMEDREEYKKGETLLIFSDDVEVGNVVLEEDCIKMEAMSIYGGVKAKTNYAVATCLTDVESFQTIQTLGLYASWNNRIDFSLDTNHHSQLMGDICFAVKIDNEFGNMVSCHSTLDYQEGDKKYNIILQKDGFPFRFIETRGDYQEEIFYNVFNTWGTCTYFHHTIRDVFTDGKDCFDYQKGSFIGENYDNKKENTAISYIRFGDKRMHRSYQTFKRVSSDDEDSKEVINRIDAMNLLDSSMRDKLNRVMDEFSVNGHSLFKTILLYGFTNYDQKEIDSLFGIDKAAIDLEQIYFGYEDAKTIGSKIFNLKQK